jgi:predicted RNA-binding Zn-ribbon protein involved in translation (DUF1610 family)
LGCIVWRELSKKNLDNLKFFGYIAEKSELVFLSELTMTLRREKMPYVDQSKAMKLCDKEICVACGQKLKSEGFTNAKGSKVYVCSESGMYPWRCLGCDWAFHLGEYFPTSRRETCPKCGEDIVNEHTY